MYDCVCGAFCVPFARTDTGPRPAGASLQGNGAASIKFAERFSGSTIEFEKFAIALDGAAVEDRGTRWKGDPVFFFVLSR